LSPREIQVLRRVRVGRTNSQIAEDLFISVKTVERHLSNIFVKLDAPNRAAAAAIAGDAGLL
jgi:DNA-binding NarL/FixJ family response regulator